MDEFQNARVLVTGASSGIGRATARTFAESGASVAVAARSEDELRELAADLESEFGVDAIAVPTDVTDETQVAEMVSTTVEEFGGLDVAVSNAGTGRGGPITEMSTDEYRAVMGVNTDGMFFVARETAPHLIASEGSLVFLGSTAGKGPRTEYPIYAASKWWTRGFALSVAGQLGAEGVAVSVVNPGTVRTSFGSEFREKNRELFEPGEALEADDIADAIAYAAAQRPQASVGEVDVVRRDEYSGL